ncbi:kelch repeat-containing protein [Cryptosporidium canis]|uniref:Kelch repeat-containing protein n=1 Tax=Cryptosporidium canis TaxID=195482 RepID=A0A9D5DJK0_9CRYT|nr:kelch repeat-containing protein [Cryptosporidium canis]
MVKKKKSDAKLKKVAEKKEKQQIKSHNKHLKELKRDGVEDIVKAIDNLDINSCSGDIEVQCSIIQSGRPTPRVSSSYNLHPISGEVIVFGGEYYDGKEVKCFHDLYKWNIDKNEWRQVIVNSKHSPDTYSGGPKPRCSHQAVVFNECLYIHGGEYSTESQFYHFRDLWRLNLRNYTWQEIKTTGLSPTPRSGHRMVVWRHFFVVFGGFHDTIRETRYFNDIHIFDTKTLHWVRIDSSKYEYCPSPRSGVQMVLCPNSDRIFIYGGYSKIKDNSKNSLGKTHSDGWILDMKPFLSERKLPVWEKVSRKGTPPPLRSGSTIIGYKNQCILFGGVFDQEDDLGLNLNSVFYNDIYVFEVTNKRWYKVELSKSKRVLEPSSGVQGKKCDSTLSTDIKPSVYNQLSSLNRMNDIDSSDIHLSNTIMSSKANSEQQNSHNNILHEDNCESGGIEISNLVSDIDYNATTSPLPRINCGMFLRGNTIYIYGGLFESGRKTVTLDDCWCFNILKKDDWECVLPLSTTQKEWTDSGSDSDSETNSYLSSDCITSTSESYYSDDGSDMDDYEHDVVEPEHKELSRKAVEEIINKYQLNDPNQTPLLGESLRDFFTRTKEYWVSLVAGEGIEGIASAKDMSRDAFKLAQERVEQTKTYLNLVGKFENNQYKCEK